MIRLIRLAVLAAALTAAVFGVACAEVVTDASATFSITVASGWTAQDTQDAMSLVGPNGIPQMNVSKEAIEGLTLDKFAKAFPVQMKKELPKFKIISSGKTKVGGIPAGVWVYSAKVEGTMLQFKNYIFFKNGVMYNVVFATVPQRFKSDSVGFDAMVKSWSWSAS